MSQQIMLWIGSILAAVGGIVAVFLKGKSDGKKLEKAKQAESNLKAQEKRVEILKEANDVSDSIGRLPDDDIQQRLRDKYSRD